MLILLTFHTQYPSAAAAVTDRDEVSGARILV